MRAKRDVSADRLRTVSLFEECSVRELGLVAESADEVAVPKGYVLVHEGDFGGEVFVVAEGEADVVDRGRRVSTVGPGAVVGEMADLGTAPHSATVTAASSMRFFVFDRAAFGALVDDVPCMSRRLSDGASYRLQGAHGPPV